METKFEMEVRSFLYRPPFSLRAVPAEHLKLFCRALTHDSAGDGRPVDSYERLEFLGDAVLEFLACERAYRDDSVPDEGGLTAMKQDWVANRRISDRVLAYGMGIDNTLRVGGGHLRSDGGHIVNENMRADCFEALLGAMYLCYGMDEARRVAEEVIFSNPLDGVPSCPDA